MNDTTKQTTIGIHPLADWFPVMEEAELKALAEDIRAIGQTDPIVTHKGKIVDGRNRHAACIMAGVAPRFEEWQGVGSLVRFVWSRNAVRRNLNSSQKAALGLELEALLKKEAEERKAAVCVDEEQVVANSPQSSDSSEATPGIKASGRTRDKIAELVGVSSRTIQDAKRVKNESPTHFAQVKAGEITINRALRQIEKSAEGANGAKKPTDDPVSKIVTCSAAVVKASQALLSVDSSQVHSKALNSAINSFGFIYTQLLPIVAQSGHMESVEQARKIVGAISCIELEPGPEDLTQLGTQPTSFVIATKNRAEQSPNSIVDPESLDWPQNSGMKILVGAHILKTAIRRAGLAAMTDDGQSEVMKSNNETCGCVLITAAGDSIAFESSVPNFSARHIVRIGEGSDAAIVGEGEICVPAKEIKAVLAQIPNDYNVSIAFVPIEGLPEESTRMPCGFVEVAGVKGKKTVAKAKIEAYPVTHFTTRQFPEASDLQLVLAGKASSIKGHYACVGFPILTDDPNQVYNKLALFPSETGVFVLGSDGRRCAIVEAKADTFTSFMNTEPEAPVTVSAEFVAPIFASLADNDDLVMAMDKAEEFIYFMSGSTSYAASMVNKAQRKKFPNYKRITDLPVGAVITVDRKQLLIAANMLLNVKQDRVLYAFDKQTKTVRIVGRGLTTIKEAAAEVEYEVVESEITGNLLCLNTKFLVEGLKKMTAEKVKLSFAPDEQRVRIEDATDPQFVYYMQVLISNKA